MSNQEPNRDKATFAGGCFWCMVAPFQEKDGVSKVIAGYTGGHKENPTYSEVCAGQTEKERTNVVFAVKIALDQADNILKPGMPADVIFLQE